MRYYKARERDYLDMIIARNYICKGIQLTVENTARFAGGESKVLVDWADVIERKPQDNRTADEIAADIIQNAGLKVVANDESIRDSGSSDVKS